MMGRDDMNIDITLKREFKVNGKEYNTIADMPNDVREAFERAMNPQSATGRQIGPLSMGTKIRFNGTEYDSPDAMPPHVRQLYEQLMRALETGSVTPEVALEIAGGTTLIRPPGDRIAAPRVATTPDKVELSFSFSLQKLIVTVILIALCFFLYFLFYS